MEMDICKGLIEIVGAKNMIQNELMSNHTTFRVGGAADFFVCPSSIQQIQDVIALAKQYNVPYFIMGNGSNLLVADDGFRGIVIQIHRNFNTVECDGTTITAMTGATLAMTASNARQCNLTGFEFAAGIPGTIGGAISMNAGAYGGEMKDVVQRVTVLDQDGAVIELAKEELELGYRTSVISKKGYIALTVTLALQPGDGEAIQAKMDEYAYARKSKQPLEYPSAGSTFKRPVGYFAGKLIQDAGLRGYRVGDAQISEKHCGFVINCGDATAADILQLIHDVQSKIYDMFQVRLETEVRMLGDI